MLNMIRMELYRMFKTKSLYVIWLVLAAGILFTTGLSADEMKTYTMEEKQEMYEYATGQQKSDTVNLGMDVTVPTKPGDTVSVFDLFYGNIKGKFLALFMVIFAVLYSTADMTSGFIKNIAGQVRDRRGLVFAKGVSLFVYTVLTMLIFTGIQTISNALFFDELVFGTCKRISAICGNTDAVTFCTAYHRDVHCDRTAQQCHQYDAECLSLYECACNLLQLSG